MYFAVLSGPLSQVVSCPTRNVGQRYGGLVAVHADQARLKHITSHQRQERRTATLSNLERIGNLDQSLKPYLSLVTSLGRQFVSCHQRMGVAPKSAVEMSEGLNQPARQHEIIKPLKQSPVVAPQTIRGILSRTHVLRVSTWAGALVEGADKAIGGRNRHPVWCAATSQNQIQHCNKPTSYCNAFAAFLRLGQIVNVLTRLINNVLRDGMQVAMYYLAVSHRNI